MDIPDIRSFEDCCIYCLSVPELVTEYNRLCGANIKALGKPTVLRTPVLGKPTVLRTPIEMMIDKACGYTPPDEHKIDQKELFRFFDFVYDCIWSTLPDEAFET